MKGERWFCAGMKPRHQLRRQHVPGIRKTRTHVSLRTRLLVQLDSRPAIEDRRYVPLPCRIRTDKRYARIVRRPLRSDRRRAWHRSRSRHCRQAVRSRSDRAGTQPRIRRAAAHGSQQPPPRAQADLRNTGQTARPWTGSARPQTTRRVSDTKVQRSHEQKKRPASPPA